MQLRHRNELGNEAVRNQSRDASDGVLRVRTSTVLRPSRFSY